MAVRLCFIDDGVVRELRAASCQFSREKGKMRVLHKAVKLVVRPPQKCELRGVVVRTRKLGELNYITLLVSHFCAFSEAKSMSGCEIVLQCRDPLLDVCRLERL